MLGKYFRTASSGPVTLLFDTFTDTDGTNLTAHTMNVGSGWTVNSGAWNITGNKAHESTTGGATYIASAQASNADVTVSADVTLDNGGFYLSGIAVRVTDQDNCWHIVIERDASGTPYIVIRQRQTGTNTDRATTSNAAWVNGTFTITAVLSGATITAFVNGVQQAQYASATFNQTTTRHGLAMFRNAQYTDNPLDTFLVTSP